jgi:hypothetical protein
LHLAVLWRFRLLLAVGFVLALLLTLLSVARVELKGGVPTLKYRGAELWSSHETLLVTQSGFPIGQSIYNEVVPLRTGNRTIVGDSTSYVPRYASDGRFATLAVLYARLANSDPVEQLLLAHGRIPGGVSLAASAVSDTQVGPLPLIQVTGMGTSRGAAIAMAHNAATSLRTYIADQQVSNNVPQESRVVLATIKRAGTPGADGLGDTALVQGHSKMKPMVVFIAVMGLFLAIAYILENLRPRIRLVPPVARPAAERRSA